MKFFLITTCLVIKLLNVTMNLSYTTCINKVAKIK